MNSVSISKFWVGFGFALIACQLNYCTAVKCTFYGEPGAGPTGEKTAAGDNMDSSAMTCSTLSHLPLGSILTVTNQRNGKSVTVKVTDRIAGATEDIIDLTYGAFGKIADHAEGAIPCSYKIE